MKQILLGNSGGTSIIGYLLAGLMAYQDIQKSGDVNWVNIAVAVLIAVLGRMAADAKSVKLMDGPQDIVGGRPDDRNKDKP